MKRLILFASITIIMAASALAQAPGRLSKVYGIAFYNLENLFDTINNNGSYDLEYSPKGSKQWDTRRYTSKLRNLAQVIAQMKSSTTPQGPAIIGVSEIENRSVLQDLVKEPAIRDRRYKVIHHDGPDPRGVDVGLLYNPRMFRPIDVRNHTLLLPENPRFRTRDQLCVTGVLDGDTISVIVGHWPSRLGGQEQSSPKREAAAALSKHISDSIWALRPNQPIIIMGDMNDDPHDKSCAQVLQARRDPQGVGLQGFYNPWWQLLDNGIGTLAYKGSWNLFDQIIVSGSLLEGNVRPGGLEYWKCRVLNFDFLIDKEGSRKGSPLRTYASGIWLDGYSDHFPTEIFLRKTVEK